MSIQLSTPEQVTRTKADIVFIGFNFINRQATIGFHISNSGDTDVREVQKQIGSAQFSAFVQACGITKQAVEQFIVDNYLPGTVT